MNKVADAGKQIIKDAESLRLRAYLCPAGKWTIGWGHTGPDVHGDLTITIEAAENLLTRDLMSAGTAVERLVSIPINDNQYSALVSFVYNFGPNALAISTLLRMLNAGDFKGASGQFALWNKAHVNGEFVVLNGLTTRRKRERDLFLTLPEPTAGDSNG